ncbi:hypothetical protein [Marinomonas atlantica]|uniref:hypothetical protein n=1 Tax=Marinomonas atlantica TaxID=1806668 RepID=UPI000831A7B5|nr:hypothetical protein [Marinomonas atlantica]
MPVTAIEAPSAAKSAINPISGVFGTGQVKLIFKDEAFTAPITGKYRIRVWGAGGCAKGDKGGGGGGFAMKVIELNAGDIVNVTVAMSLLGNTSSFGSHVSATSGETGVIPVEKTHAVGGEGVGGDVNFKGGRGQYSGSTTQQVGGGAASLLGDGGDAVSKEYFGGSSAGIPVTTGSSYGRVTAGHEYSFSECLEFGLDLIGAGAGSTDFERAASGGGACTDYTFAQAGAGAGFPGGGASPRSPEGLGANGLVAVEY